MTHKIELNSKVKVIGDKFPNITGTAINVTEDRVDIGFTYYVTNSKTQRQGYDIVSIPIKYVIQLNKDYVFMADGTPVEYNEDEQE